MTIIDVKESVVACAQRRAIWLGRDRLDDSRWRDGRAKKRDRAPDSRHAAVYIGGGGILSSLRGEAIGKGNQAAN